MPFPSSVTIEYRINKMSMPNEAYRMYRPLSREALSNL